MAGTPIVTRRVIAAVVTVPLALSACSGSSNTSSIPHGPAAAYALIHGGSVVPVVAATGTFGAPVKGVSNAEDIVAAPDGKAVYLVTRGGTVTPVSTATSVLGKPIRVDASGDLQIAPDGKTAYAWGSSGGAPGIVPVDLATGRPSKVIKISDPDWLVFTPDSKTAYVVSSQQQRIIPVQTATGTVGKPIQLPGFKEPGSRHTVRAYINSLAVTPDGKTLYVATTAQLIPVNTATGTAGKPVKNIGPPLSILITPGGKTLYATVSLPYPGRLVPLDTTTNTAGTPIDIPNADSMTITPDGTTLYVTSLYGDVTQVSTATGATDPLGSAKDIALTANGKTLYAIQTCGGGVVPVHAATSTAGRPINVGNLPADSIITVPPPGCACASIPPGTPVPAPGQKC